MKAISLWQPHASLIYLGLKQYEMAIGVWEGKEFFIPHHLLMICEIIEGRAVEKFFNYDKVYLDHSQFIVGDRVRDTFNPRRPRKGKITETPENWAIVLWDGVKKPNQWSYEYLRKDDSWKERADFKEVPRQIKKSGQATIFYDASGEPPEPDDFVRQMLHLGKPQDRTASTIEEYEDAWKKWENLPQEYCSAAAGVVHRVRSPQDTNPSGQLKTTPTPQLSTESDSQTLDSLNKTLPPLTTNLSLRSPLPTLSFLQHLALTFPWLENEPDLMELAEACFLKDSDLFGSNAHLHSSLKMLTDSLAQTTELPSRKSSKRLQVWGIAAPGNLGMVTGTSPKTENGFSSWAITAQVKATQPKSTKKTLQEVFETQAIPVKVYVDGVEKTQVAPALCAKSAGAEYLAGSLCAGGWQHRSLLHRDKRGASFAVLYRAAGGDRLYHEESPTLRSLSCTGNHQSGSGAYKIREYQGETYIERPINATEAEQLMGWEIGSTAIGINGEGDEINISQTQRIKMLGNGIIPAEITDILTAIKPMLERKLESEIPAGCDFAYRQLRQRGMSHQESVSFLAITSSPTI